jgi:lipopolysaccharide/colanic/teichoic acid biosynthesis glycosyltransferase
MGKDCKPFLALKFRSMLVANQIKRKYDEPVEYDRITSLGRFLRQTRFDEIPQIINVLRGEMSLIGPRPDYYDHALIFAKNINGYRERHIIRPGISGLSQIRLGYAEGMRATRSKTIVDTFYIKNAGFYLDFKIIAGTILTVFKQKGI